MTAIIILAAGESSRLGRPKQLLTFQGESLLRRSTRVALEARCGPVIVVLGFAAQQMVPELENLPVQMVINQDWKDGMASSLRAALRAVPKEADAALLMLCDQPGVDVDTLRKMNSRFEQGAAIVACSYRGVMGVPALFSREFFGELNQLKGDRGARSVLHRHRAEMEVIDCPGAALDIDTEAEYRQLIQDA
ncbi:MAG TPA: nucleotidyltransferase family protein [Acidobacteriota bacterium]|nr:nucleotidyltransferase family protein [Acidobacteriota bacterium]